VGERELILQVREISRSGIFVYTKEPLGKLGAVFTLKLSIIAGIRPTTVDGQIVRIAKDAQGATLGTALRFLNVQAPQHNAIIDLIDRAMNGRGTGPRAFPRISYLIEVKCTTTAELQAMLRDIGEGGAGLELYRAVQVGSEVLVELSLGEERSPLQIGGFVTSCEPEKEGKFRAGVRFRKLTNELRDELNRFLRELYRR
jgi:c-di-GMP-binding flagellar brake protein YcgR